MSSEPPLRRLVEQTATAIERTAAEEEAARDRRPPAPGDLFVLPATAAWPLEWLLLQLDGDRARVVPADGFAAFAPADVVVAAGEPGGPLVLHGGHSAWIDARRLDVEERSGRLPSAAVERVRFLVDRPAAALPTSAPLDDELGSWQAELDAARSALLAAAAVPAPPRRRKLASPRFFGIAASLFLVVSAVLAARLAVVSTAMERLERERRGNATARAQLETLRRQEAELRGRASALSRELEAARAAAATATARDQQRRAQTPPASINVPFLWLAADETVRGEAQSLSVPASGDLVVLIVPLVEPSRFARYRVELVRGGRVVWRSDDLVPAGVAELSLALPRSLLPPAGYQLRVSGLAAGGARPVSSFHFRVAAPRGRTRRRRRMDETGPRVARAGAAGCARGRVASRRRPGTPPRRAAR